MAENPRYCSNCGEKLDLRENEINCPKCGIETKSNIVSPRPIVQYVPHKSSGTAALLAFIGGIFGLCGIGHIYVGKVGRGIGILILGIVIYAIAAFSIWGMVFVSMSLDQSGQNTPAAGGFLVGIFFSIVYLIFFIWQIFSARGWAKKFNKLARTTGTEPW